MNRLTRPDVSVDPTAARLIGPEVKIENISDKLLHLILNGPTLHSVPKDTLRFLLRQLYDELKAYEDTGLTPEEIVEMYGEMKTAYDESGGPYLVEATGLQAKRIIDRELAEVQGRLIVLPCKPGKLAYIVCDLRETEFPGIAEIIGPYHVCDVSPKGFWIQKKPGADRHFRYWREVGNTVFWSKQKAETARDSIIADANTAPSQKEV